MEQLKLFSQKIPTNPLQAISGRSPDTSPIQAQFNITQQNFGGSAFGDNII